MVQLILLHLDLVLMEQTQYFQLLLRLEVLVDEEELILVRELMEDKVVLEEEEQMEK